MTAEPDSEVDALYVTYVVGGASTSAGAPMHAGKEYGYVVAGELRVEIGFEHHELGPGDSIAFESTHPHRLSNVSRRAGVGGAAVGNRRGVGLR